MSNNNPMTQEQLDAIRGYAESATTLRSASFNDWQALALDLSECVDDLLAEVERLRALTTVDEAMVERAARESYGPQMWDRLLAAGHGVAQVQLSAHCAMTRATLEAALDPAIARRNDHAPQGATPATGAE